MWSYFSHSGNSTVDFTDFSLFVDQFCQGDTAGSPNGFQFGPRNADGTALLQNHHARTNRMLIETIVSGWRSIETVTDLGLDQLLAKTLLNLSAGLLGASKLLSGIVDPEAMVDSALTIFRCC